MFGIGWAELLAIAIVMAVAIKPEQLPEAARTLGRIYGQLQRLIFDARQSLDKEADEFKRTSGFSGSLEKLNDGRKFNEIDCNTYPDDRKVQDAGEYDEYRREPENSKKECSVESNSDGAKAFALLQGENQPGGFSGIIKHIAELRSRLIKSIISLIPGFILAFIFAEFIFEILARPLKAVLPAGSGLIATALPDNFLVYMKIAIWGGFFLASPYWLYQLWAFVFPGLYGRERRYLKSLSLGSALLFLAGALFGYYVIIPLSFTFFASIGSGDVTLLPSARQYLSLITGMLAAFALAFQLPLVLLFSAYLGLVKAGNLRTFRRYAVLIIFILAAVLTPPDVLSQILLALPMIALYELSIFLIARQESSQLDVPGNSN